MTTAEELRKYADKALKEGGIMYFSDEYLDALASRAEAEQAEAEKLRHENESLRANAVNWELEHCPACKNVADLQEAISEREKLRELVRDLESARSALCDEYPSRIDVACDECPAHNVCDANPIGRMRELGIEVDG